ncbi:hypothetical protein B0H14DRAFT_1137337 [Mycena olivaceomarginata]|nr:hypothetical protein B0H14DRAFT_1137337 [Mycena olivaceomarginata]
MFLVSCSGHLSIFTLAVRVTLLLAAPITRCCLRFFDNVLRCGQFSLPMANANAHVCFQGTKKMNPVHPGQCTSHIFQVSSFQQPVHRHLYDEPHHSPHCDKYLLHQECASPIPPSTIVSSQQPQPPPVRASSDPRIPPTCAFAPRATPPPRSDSPLGHTRSAHKARAGRETQSLAARSAAAPAGTRTLWRRRSGAAGGTP